MSDLRTRTIRLAHQRPDLRPHLLPLLRAAGSASQVKEWIPTTAYDFGLEGPTADQHAADLAVVLKAAVHQARREADASWKDMARLILRAQRADAQPEVSRAAVSETLKYMYLELAKLVDAYFPKVRPPRSQ